MSATTREFGQIQFKLSHPDKIMFPEVGMTKQDLVEDYQNIAYVMLPHIENHPINMQRFPDGIDRVKVEVKEQDRSQDQVVCNKIDMLAYLGNQACITPHIWLSRVDQLNHPDKLIFDLDPPRDHFRLVKEAAWRFKDVLEEGGLTPFVMTTGSRGLHIVAPIKTSVDFDSSHAFARDLCHVLAEQYPEQMTVEMRKNQREGSCFWTTRAILTARLQLPPTHCTPNPAHRLPSHWIGMS